MKSPANSPSATGAALVIVVVLVSMLMVMILAFFSLAKIERRASSAYAQSVTADVLSESALNTVIAQIRDATSNLGTTETWASQPGMLRRYDDSGNLVGAYKLYSSDQMVAGSGFDPDSEVPPGDWESKPGLWTDLNEPAEFDDDGDQKPDRFTYPIVDPTVLEATAGSAPEIEGFEVENAPGARDTREIPMPVQWLYHAGGRHPRGPERRHRHQRDRPGATTDNPVVGRIAFWADDECSKVNINTASEGFYWDPPRTNSTSETHFADRQPMVSEFQRYAGHPATTCLSPILGKWLGDPASTTMARAADMLENYYKLTPRIVYGGSVEATKSNAQISTTTFRRFELKLGDDRDRLYSSVDEYVFGASERIANEGFEDSSDTPREIIEKTSFFLTAHSQAPEVNLFNQPRIALWPVQADEGDRNIVDQLIAFCSSTRSGSAPTPYYFQRPSVHSRGGFSSSQSPSQFWNVSRNQQLYGYLQDLMGRKIPGYGDSFQGKFGADAEQIATEMVDYLRSGLNTSSFGRKTDNNANGYSYVPPRTVRGFTASPGESQVIPLKLRDTMGFGRNQTITEAAIVIYPTKYTPSEDNFLIDIPGPASRPQIKGFKASAVQAFLLLEFFNPAPGLPSWSPYITVDIQGLDGFSLSEGGSLNMPATASMTLDSIIGPAGGQVGQDAPGNCNISGIGYGNNTPHFGIFQPFFEGGTRPRKIRSARTFAFQSTADCPLSAGASPEGLPPPALRRRPRHHHQVRRHRRPRADDQHEVPGHGHPPPLCLRLQQDTPVPRATQPRRLPACHPETSLTARIAAAHHRLPVEHHPPRRRGALDGGGQGRGPQRRPALLLRHARRSRRLVPRRRRAPQRPQPTNETIDQWNSTDPVERPLRPGPAPIQRLAVLGPVLHRRQAAERQRCHQQQPRRPPVLPHRVDAHLRVHRPPPPPLHRRRHRTTGRSTATPTSSRPAD